MLQNRAIQLNPLELTGSKKAELSRLCSEYLEVSKQVFEFWKSHKGITQTELHNLTYKNLRQASDLPAQLVISSRIAVWSRRKKTKALNRIPILFDCRSFKYVSTKRNNPTICISSYRRGMLGIPLSKDGTFNRFQNFLKEGWTFKIARLLKKKSGFKIQLILQREFKIHAPKPGQNILSIDIGSASLGAITVLSPAGSQIIRQLYVGRDVALRQRRILGRRRKLQSKADKSSRARKRLRKLRSYETNFVKTRCWQVSNEIMKLAFEFNAAVVVEDLKHLRGAMNFGKRTNRKVHKIPYLRLFHSLRMVLTRNLISLSKVDPRNTSRTCPNCGFTSKSNRKRWSTFLCRSCGYTANSDRVASVNIARKFNSALERSNIQISRAGVPVNAPARFNEPAVGARGASISR